MRAKSQLEFKSVNTSTWEKNLRGGVGENEEYLERHIGDLNFTISMQKVHSPMRKLIEMEEYVPPQLKLPPQLQVSLE